MKKTNPSAGVVEFAFEEGLDPVSINILNYPMAILEFLPIHGAMAKLGDAAAIPRKNKDGSVVTVTEAMRRQAVLDMHAQLMAGDWNGKRSATPAQNPMIAAIAAKRGITYEEAQALIAEQFLGELSA